jgi:hypothetical protein
MTARGTESSVKGSSPCALSQGFFDRRGGWCEGQLVNHHMLAQLARQVDAFAKGLQAKDDGALASAHAPGVFLEQLGARAYALHLHLAKQVRGQGGKTRLHLAPGGEQHELAVLVLAQQRRQLFA